MVGKSSTWVGERAGGRGKGRGLVEGGLFLFLNAIYGLLCFGSMFDAEPDEVPVLNHRA